MLRGSDLGAEGMRVGWREPKSGLWPKAPAPLVKAGRGGCPSEGRMREKGYPFARAFPLQGEGDTCSSPSEKPLFCCRVTN